MCIRNQPEPNKNVVVFAFEPRLKETAIKLWALRLYCVGTLTIQLVHTKHTYLSICSPVFPLFVFGEGERYVRFSSIPKKIMRNEPMAKRENEKTACVMFFHSSILCICIENIYELSRDKEI